MQDAAQIALESLEEQHDARDLDAAGGRAGAAAGEHHNEQYKTAELRPEVEILCAVAGGGNERCDLKGRVLDGGADGTARFENKIERDERGRAEHDAGVDAQLVAAQDLPPAPCTGQKQKREIDRRDEHEDHDDPVDRRGLVVGDAFVADGEAAGRDGRERGGHRVEPRHPRRAERERFRRREENVDAVKHFGRVVRARQQLGGDGAGAFGLHQVDAALAELRHQREQQDENAHAAEPLRQRAPELDAARQRGRRAEDGGARRREAGNGLEQRVHIAAAAAERIGQRAEGGQHDPAERHGDIAVAVLQA